jgi:uncharacterized membrane protein
MATCEENELYADTYNETERKKTRRVLYWVALFYAMVQLIFIAVKYFSYAIFARVPWWQVVLPTFVCMVSFVIAKITLFIHDLVCVEECSDDGGSDYQSLEEGSKQSVDV